MASRIASAFLSAVFLTAAFIVAVAAYFDATMRCEGGFGYALLFTGFIGMLMAFQPLLVTLFFGVIAGAAFGRRSVRVTGALLALLLFAVVAIELVPHRSIPQDQSPCRVGGP